MPTKRLPIKCAPAGTPAPGQQQAFHFPPPQQAGLYQANYPYVYRPPGGYGFDPRSKGSFHEVPPHAQAHHTLQCHLGLSEYCSAVCSVISPMHD